MSDGKRGGSAGGEDRQKREEKGRNHTPSSKCKKKSTGPHRGRRRHSVRLAALDLGTNNCRLLIASPHRRGFRIVDAFSRIVRLGEGLSQSGVLSDAAMDRTIAALKVCADKIDRRGVTHMRCIATQACRGANNGTEFLNRVTQETGLKFDIITTEEEARLSVAGCADLLDEDVEAGLVFDIGGGSTELSWVRRRAGGTEITAWTSLPFGVVSIAEKWGGHEMSAETYAAVVEDVRKSVAEIGDPASLKDVFENDKAHLLGTSGTVTSIAGVHLELARYRRDRVDGLWLTIDDAKAVTSKLCAMSFPERAAEPCIGEERADLVVSGCAILEALQAEWPARRIRVADRGLREGVLADLARQARKSGKR